MRRAVSCLKAACAPSRPFASSAGEVGSSGGLDSAAKATQLGAGVIAVVAAIATGGYALHTVDAKLLTMDARLTGKVETIEAKVAGAQREVEAKVAGVKETVTKEVDAKMAGIVKEVDAKLAGAANKTARW
jgi:diphthamide synthase (EF-2-diphthine--ammonia ligase)